MFVFNAVWQHAKLVTGIYKPVFNSSVIVMFGGISCSFDISFRRLKLKSDRKACVETVYMFGKGRGRTLSSVTL